METPEEPGAKKALTFGHQTKPLEGIPEGGTEELSLPLHPGQIPKKCIKIEKNKQLFHLYLVPYQFLHQKLIGFGHGGGACPNPMSVWCRN